MARSLGIVLCVASVPVLLLLSSAALGSNTQPQPVSRERVFLDAIIDGDIQQVEQLLANDPNLVSAVDVRGKGMCIPALHLAVMYGHSNVVELLLAKGAKANERDIYGVSPLGLAAKRGHANVVAPLVSYGADIDGEQHELRRPPLFYASNGEVAEALIANGADATQQDNLKITPLHFIAQDGATEAAQVLIKHGANVDARDKWGQTPLHWAAKRGRKDVAELLSAAGADINARDDHGLTALSRANQEDIWVDEQARSELGQFLVLRGAHYSINDVAWLGDMEKVRKLLQSDPNLANAVAGGSRGSVLGTAVLAGQTDVARLLLAYGADPNGTSRLGLPSLHIAAALGNRAIVKLLLDAGVDVNKQGKNGENALHWAAAKGYDQIVQLLLQAGANVNAEAREARCDIDVLPPEDFDTISELLRYRQACAQQQQNPRLQIMDLIRVAFAAGDTPLHSAAQWGHTEIARLLLTSGAAVNAANKCEQTPLHYASAFRHKEIVELFIEAGADVNRQEKNGYTPLALASWPEGTPLDETARFLIENNAM